MLAINRILLFLSILLPVAAWGQSPADSIPSIKARAEVHRDSIMLRWLASDARSWEALNRYGVRLERLTIARGGVALEQPEVKTLSPELKPQESDELKQLVAKYPLGSIIAQAIFGEEFEVSMGGKSGIARAIALDEQREQRYLFSLYAADLCFPVAKEIGWGWVDTDIQPNARYLYRITPLVPEKELRVEQGGVFVVANDTARLVAPLSLSVTFADGTALLAWDYNTLSYLYSAYVVERSDDGVTFTPTSDLPITRLADANLNPNAPISYLDSIPTGKRFYYRVAGITPFGSRGAYSTVVSGISHPSLTATPFITESSFDRRGGALLSWSFDASQEERITGFSILHSPDDSQYTVAVKGLSPKDRQVHLAKLSRNIYYRVEATAKHGSSTQSLSILLQPVDSIPPAVPQGLKAQIDSLGAVHLTWRANTDNDLYGYRLYRGLTRGEELIPITDTAIRDNRFTDSVGLDNLNSRVYYAITALDERYNQSGLSAVTEAIKPNTIPPTAPAITSIETQEGKNLVTWVAGRDPYLAGFNILRRAGNDTAFTQIAQLADPQSNSYTDNQISTGASYEYQVQAYSSGGLRSPMSPPSRVKSKLASKGKRSSTSFSLESRPEGVGIRWSTDSAQLIAIQLYKYDAEGQLYLYRDGLPHSGEILDAEVLLGKANQYMLVVKSKGQKPIMIKKEIKQ